MSAARPGTSPRGSRAIPLVLAAGLVFAASPVWSIDLDDVADVADTVDVGESGLLNGSSTFGGFGAVQTAGDFVANFVETGSCDLVTCTIDRREIILRRETSAGLEPVVTYGNLPDNFESFELETFDGCIAPGVCDRLLIAFVLAESESALSIQIFDVFNPEPAFVVARADLAGSPPFDFSFVAIPKDRDSAIVDIFFGLPEEGANGIVRAIRVDGETQTIRDLEPPSAVRRLAKGGASARFGASLGVTPDGLCIGQSPAEASPVGAATEASISLVSGIFANLGVPAYSTAFGKFPLGQAVTTSGNRCASSAPGEVTLCDGTCRNPTRFGGVGTEQGFGRSVSLTGEEMLVGGGGGDTGEVYQYAFGNAGFEPLAAITSSNPAFGASPLVPTRRSLVTTLSETRSEGNIQLQRTRTELLRLRGVRLRLFGDSFDPLVDGAP